MDGEECRNAVFQIINPKPLYKSGGSAYLLRSYTCKLQATIRFSRNWVRKMYSPFDSGSPLATMYAATQFSIQIRIKNT